MKLNKKIIINSIFLILANICFAFDWPQDDITKDSFKSYYGQYRGGQISTSVVFENHTNIKAAENGELLIIMTNNNDDNDFFPTTLGHSVILSHQDNILSVYGNLDKSSINITPKQNEQDINIGEYFAQTGNSGWQDKFSSLEFQIIDIKNSSSINPKVLMTRTENEIPLLLTDIILKNKNGNIIDLAISKTIPTGLYKIYKKRNAVACPYKTSVYLNGVVVDTVSYDITIQENGKICVLGKKKYTLEDIYPNETNQLIGEAMLTPGKTTLTVNSTDILGKNTQKNFNLNVK